MLIQKVDTAREAFSDYSLEGTILSIGGIEVDLESEQEDQEVIVTFSNHNGMIRRGIMACCEYVAEVIIPPRRYDLVEVEDERGEAEEGPKTKTENVPVALDVASVILKLWPIEHNRQEEIGLIGENNAN